MSTTNLFLFFFFLISKSMKIKTYYSREPPQSEDPAANWPTSPYSHSERKSHFFFFFRKINLKIPILKLLEGKIEKKKKEEVDEKK